jgi:hypothetical protein
MWPTKIVVIGAGSASFGLNTVAALLGSPRLRRLLAVVNVINDAVVAYPDSIGLVTLYLDIAGRPRIVA